MTTTEQAVEQDDQRGDADAGGQLRAISHAADGVLSTRSRCRRDATRRRTTGPARRLTRAAAVPPASRQRHRRRLASRARPTANASHSEQTRRRGSSAHASRVDRQT